MFWKKCRFFFPIQKKYALCGVLCVFLLDFFGFFAHLFEKDFNLNFRYPYEGNVTEFVVELERGLKPRIEPLNQYNFPFLHANPNKCDIHNKENPPRLIYIVKSSLRNFENRKIIRRTWGFEKRFSDVKILTVFMLGNTQDDELRLLIDEENEKYKDIVQVDFVDTYYNNTIKTMNAFKWVVQFCSNSRYYFFSDDDMYISTKNVLRFLHNPTKYPEYLQIPSSMGSETDTNTENQSTELLQNIRNHIRIAYSYDLPENVSLYAGFVFLSSPQRHKFSKWYVSLNEYPYNMWPPYIPAGAYVLSKTALFKLYYASFYTKHFRFDDIYLGIVAMKAGIQPYHCDQFYFYKKKYNSVEYKYVIASHGYNNPIELESAWSQQKELGNA